MTNPFSVLEESHSQPKTQKKKKVENRKKKSAKKPVEKKKPQVVKTTQQAPKRKPKLLFPSSETKKDEKSVEGGVEGGVEGTEKVTSVEKRSFDGPSRLKTYKRDNNKPYFNRNQGKGPAQKGGKRYNQRDRSINRTGKRNSPYRKNGEGGKHSWNGRYVKKKPQEMNDEEWDKSIEIDKQNQKNEDSKKAHVAKKKVEKKKFEGKKVEKKDDKKTEEKKADDKKDSKKKPFKKGKRDFKKRGKFDRKDKDEEVEEEEEDDSDKTTYEEYMKNRNKPISITEGKARKAREGVKVQAKQLEFTRVLKRENQNYMKLSKKKNQKGKKDEKKDEKTKPKPKSKKKSKKKQLSTADFFKGTKKNKNFKGKGFKAKGQKKSIPNLKDNKNFPSLS